MELITWDSPLGAVGGRHASKIVEATDMTRVGQLLRHFPRTYIQKGHLSRLDSLQEGDVLSVVGRIKSSMLKPYRDRRTGREAYRLEVQLDTEETTLLMNWFDRNKGTATWRSKEFRVGRVGMFSGRAKQWRGRWELVNPYARMSGRSATAELAPLPDLVPIYPAFKGVTTWQIEDTINFALTLLDRLPDPLPEQVREAEELLDLRTAYEWIHRPGSYSQLQQARKRLKFDEAFVVQVVYARARALRRAQSATGRPARSTGILVSFDAQLPFTLTQGQLQVGDTIAQELARPEPMHRLLQGEVGAGKTVVALRAMLQVVAAGGQAVLLAPTEVLAQQHYRSITQMLGPLAQAGQFGSPPEATQVTLLTGSSTAHQRREALGLMASGEAGISVGTHALLEDHVQFADLGLVVVDEQHRFGVAQRAALTAKTDPPPHLLVMTATPIPRTVAMTVFGELDVSTLAQLPEGRGDIQTTVVPEKAQPHWLDRAWQRAREEVQQGRQVYIVCPRIHADPADPDPDVYAVEELAEQLRAGPLADLRVAVLHGEMSAEAKEAVMTTFAAGDSDVIVSTTVIEVGVDVPNATMMIIMDADRFGVSQLHQLRGRIGRGGHDGLCLLVTKVAGDSDTAERLWAVASSRDGFELSLLDLKHRQEGNVLGAAQSGGSSDLALVSVVQDEALIKSARSSAIAYVEEDPQLAKNSVLAAMVNTIEASQAADFLEMG